MRKPAAPKKTNTDVATSAAAKPAVKPAAKPAARAATKPAAKPAAKPVAQAAVKPAAKPAAKAAAKPAAKTAAKPAAKSAAKSAAKPAPKAVKPVKSKAPAAEEQVREKATKTELVRDSFTMPAHEYEVLGKVKKACLKAGFEIKKSELLRIGVALISQMDMATLQRVLGDLPQLKTGRPKKI